MKIYFFKKETNKRKTYKKKKYKNSYIAYESLHSLTIRRIIFLKVFIMSVT